MPSSYTTSLRLVLPATGELAGQWGNSINQGITELLDAAVAGTASISTWGGAGVAYTLSNNSGTSDEARRMFIVATGAPGEAKNVICPAVSKFYVFRNDTTGGFALTLKTPSGTGIAVPAGQYKFLYCNGTDVVEAFNSAGALTLSGALSVGGTTTLASNPTLSAGTANQVQYLNGSKVLVGSANMTFDGTSLTLGGNPTLSAGTAQGVLYLNGSKVATSGSALTFDGANLGVGVAVPGQVIDGSAANPRLRLTATSTGYAASQFVNSSGSSYFGRDNSVGGFFGIANGTAIYSSTSDPIGFYLSGSEQMRLTSTGLGIGTSSPSYKLDVQGGSARADAFVGPNNLTSYMNLAQSNGLVVRGAAGSPANQVELWTLGSVKATLDSSGNLGLGVTPSAWATANGQRAIQVSGVASISQQGNGSTNVMCNAYEGGTNTFNYVVTAGAMRYNQSASGGHSWYTAPSGTAGNAISFTQSMTLDSSGNLGIGTSSPAYKLDVIASGDASSRIRTTQAVVGASAQLLLETANTFNSLSQAFVKAVSINDGNAEIALTFGTSSGTSAASERMRLDSSGNLGLGVTPSAWNSTSKALQISAFVSVSQQASGAANFGFNFYEDAGNTFKYISTDEACRFSALTDGGFGWYTAPSGTAGNAISFTQAMTLTSGGDLLVGTASSDGIRLQVVGPANSEYARMGGGDAPARNLRFSSFVANGANNAGHLINAPGATGTEGTLAFATNSTERARITSGGYFKASNNGTYLNSAGAYHELRQSAADYIARTANTNATAANCFGLYVEYTAAAPNGTGNDFIICADNATTRASIRSNGGLANYSGNDVNLSDRREKTNFAPAKSYLDTICAIPVQTFNYIDQSEDDPGLTLGVVAQDVQAVAPELVMESNWGTEDDPKMRLSIYQTDLQYALMKALQELKAQNDDLRARVAALESN